MEWQDPPSVGSGLSGFQELLQSQYFMLAGEEDLALKSFDFVNLSLANRANKRREKLTFAASSNVSAGNTKGGNINVLLTSCLTGWESAVSQLTIFIFI